MQRTSIVFATVVAILLVSPTNSHAGGYSDYISPEIRQQHPDLTFEFADEGDEYAELVWLPVQGKKVGVKLYYDRVGFTVFDAYGYIGLELIMDGNVVQIGTCINTSSSWEESFRVKNWGSVTFDKALHEVNGFVDQHNEEAQADDDSVAPLDFQVLSERGTFSEEGYFRRVQLMNVHGMPLLIFYGGGAGYIGEGHKASESVLFSKFILPGWLIDPDGDIYTEPELDSLTRIEDTSLTYPEKHIDDRAEFVNIIPKEVRDAVEEDRAKINFPKSVDLTNPEEIVIRSKENELIIRQYIDYRYYTGEVRAGYEYVALEFESNGRIMQYAHHLPDRVFQRVKFWNGTSAGSGMQFATLSDLERKKTDKFRVVSEPNWPLASQNDGLGQALRFTQGDFVVGVNYERDGDDNFVNQINIGFLDSSHLPIALEFEHESDHGNYVSLFEGWRYILQK